MGVERATAHPLKYSYMEMMGELLDVRAASSGRAGEDRLCLRFELEGASDQRRTALILAKALDARAVHLRDSAWKSVYNRGYYAAAGWTVSGNQVITEDFAPDDMRRVLAGIGALKARGYRPDGELSVSPCAGVGRARALRICGALDGARSELQAALGLNARVMYMGYLALGIQMREFELAKIEAAVRLIAEALRA